MAARLRPRDTQRLTRALEVLAATGRSLALWQSEPGTPVLPEGETERLLVLPERADLHARCDQRFDAMMAAGAEGEAAALLALGLAPGLPVLGALGVGPLAAMMAGLLSRDEAIAKAKAETRQYAKRQLTWIRRHMSSWNVYCAQ
jgi:tRNA dimethylallyltransferase